MNVRLLFNYIVGALGLIIYLWVCVCVVRFLLEGTDVPNFNHPGRRLILEQKMKRSEVEFSFEEKFPSLFGALSQFVLGFKAWG